MLEMTSTEQEFENKYAHLFPAGDNFPLPIAKTASTFVYPDNIRTTLKRRAPSPPKIKTLETRSYSLKNLHELGPILVKSATFPNRSPTTSDVCFAFQISMESSTTERKSKLKTFSNPLTRSNVCTFRTLKNRGSFRRAIKRKTQSLSNLHTDNPPVIETATAGLKVLDEVTEDPSKTSNSNDDPDYIDNYQLTTKDNENIQGESSNGNVMIDEIKAVEPFRNDGGNKVAGGIAHLSHVHSTHVQVKSPHLDCNLDSKQIDDHCVGNAAAKVVSFNNQGTKHTPHADHSSCNSCGSSSMHSGPNCLPCSLVHQKRDGINSHSRSSPQRNTLQTPCNYRGCNNPSDGRKTFEEQDNLAMKYMYSCSPDDRNLADSPAWMQDILSKLSNQTSTLLSTNPQNYDAGEEGKCNLTLAQFPCIDSSNCGHLLEEKHICAPANQIAQISKENMQKHSPCSNRPSLPLPAEDSTLINHIRESSYNTLPKPSAKMKVPPLKPPRSISSASVKPKMESKPISHPVVEKNNVDNDNLCAEVTEKPATNIENDEDLNIKQLELYYFRKKSFDQMSEKNMTRPSTPKHCGKTPRRPSVSLGLPGSRFLRKNSLKKRDRLRNALASSKLFRFSLKTSFGNFKLTGKKYFSRSSVPNEGEEINKSKYSSEKPFNNASSFCIPRVVIDSEHVLEPSCLLDINHNTAEYLHRKIPSSFSENDITELSCTSLDINSNLVHSPEENGLQNDFPEGQTCMTSL